MTPTDDEALVAELRRLRAEMGKARSKNERDLATIRFVHALRSAECRLLALADEAIAARVEIERLRDKATRACRRSQFHKDNHLAAEAENESLRRVRDAAWEYRLVEQRDASSSAEVFAGLDDLYRAMDEHEKSLRAALDADAARGKS